MKSIKQTYLIHASLVKVWEALVNPKEIESWGGGPAKMNDKVGTKFSLWGGSIHGTNNEVVREKKLIQDWFSDSDHKKWTEPSKVTFELHQVKEQVQLNLTHKNVPHEDIKAIADGWKEYYLGPLKEYVEGK